MLTPRYTPTFAALSPAQATFLARALDFLPADTPDLPLVSGLELLELCEKAELSHVDVVLAVASDPRPSTTALLETLLGPGKSIEKAPPSPAMGDLPPLKADGTSAYRAARPRPQPKRSTSAPDLRIVLSVKPNPKRGAPALRYEHWRVGETVQSAIDRGMTRADVAWDTDPKRAFVILGEPEGSVEMTTNAEDLS